MYIMYIFIKVYIGLPYLHAFQLHVYFKVYETQRQGLSGATRIKIAVFGRYSRWTPVFRNTC